jgi:hypothetical protein
MRFHLSGRKRCKLLILSVSRFFFASLYVNPCHKTIGRLVLANTTGSFALRRSKLNELFKGTIEMADQNNAAHLNRG